MTVDLKMPSYETPQITDLTVALEPVQDTSGGDPSPSNICPITGWTGAKVTRTGRNLFDQSNTSFLATNARSYGRNDKRALAQINKLPAGTYTLSFTGKVVSLNDIEAVPTRIGLYLRATSDGKVFNVPAQSDMMTLQVGDIWSNSVTFTLTDKFVGKFQYFYVYTGKNDSYKAPNEHTCNIYDVQIEPGSTATAYEPYQGQTYSITFPAEAGTVYGGTLDVLTGVLTVDRENIDSYAGETLPGEWISDRDVYASGTTPTTGAQVVYKLATPTTVQLTAHEVETLTGINNVWSDSGDVTVTISGTTQTGDVVTFTALPHHKIQLFMP